MKTTTDGMTEGELAAQLRRTLEALRFDLRPQLTFGDHFNQAVVDGINRLDGLCDVFWSRSLATARAAGDGEPKLVGVEQRDVTVTGFGVDSGKLATVVIGGEWFYRPSASPNVATPAEAEAAMAAEYPKSVGAYAVEVAKQAYDDGFAEGVASIAPSPPDALDREAVARIIEPAAWQKLDRERRNLTKTHANKVLWNWLRYYEMGCEPSLAKADAIIALAPARGWRDIASAPRDGTEILVGGGLLLYDNETFPDWRPCKGVAIAAWQYRDGAGGADGWRGEPCSSHDDWVWHRPTHWQPLPAAPETKASK